jgi:hypothetical protein
MSAGPVTTTALLNAEEYGQRPDPGYPAELVRERIVPTSRPKARHSEIGSRAVPILGACAVAMRRFFE